MLGRGHIVPSVERSRCFVKEVLWCHQTAHLTAYPYTSYLLTSMSDQSPVASEKVNGDPDGLRILVIGKRRSHAPQSLSQGPAPHKLTKRPTMGPQKWPSAQARGVADNQTMTNTLAIWIVILIAAFLTVDAIAFDWDLSVFLGRKFADLLWWMAFWR